MGQRVIIGINPGEEARGLCAIDHFAGREDARSRNQARLLALCRGEDHAGAGGWVVDRSDPHRQILKQGPVLLRDQIARAIGTVRMRIDEAGHDHLARHIDHCRAIRNRGFSSRANRADPVTADDNRGVIDRTYAIAGHSENTSTGKRHGTARLGCINCQGERDTDLWRREAFAIVLFPLGRVGEQVCHLRGLEHWTDGPVDHRAIA